MKLYQLLVNQPHLKKYATVKVAVHFPEPWVESIKK